MTFLDFENELCKLCGLGASIDAFHSRGQGLIPWQSNLSFLHWIVLIRPLCRGIYFLGKNIF